MRHLKFLIASVVALGLIGGGGYYAYTKISRLLVLRIATGPAGGFGAQFSTAIVHLIALDRPRLRVTSTPYPDEAQALKALQDGRADVAILRADTGESPGLTVAVIRHDAGLFLVPHNSKVDSVAGLKGETIGVVGANPNDVALFEAVRDAYGLSQHGDPVRLALPDVPDAVRSKKVQAIFVVGAAGGVFVNQAIAAMKSGTGGAPHIVAVDEADAIVKRNHRLEAVDWPKGILQGSPPVPDDDLTTLGVSTRVFATERMPDEVAAELTRILMMDKPKVASLLPKSALVEPPDTDKLNASLPIHPGTAAYLTGNQQSLSDEAQNFLYWVGIIGSLLASSAAALVALFRWLVPPRRDATLRLVDLWIAARAATSEADLMSIEQDVDRLLEETARMQATGKGNDLDSAFPLLVGQVRQVLDKRRAELSVHARTSPRPTADESAA
jgi:TRAP-type uncharacterized transport system substrate-binding protein